MEKQYYSAAEVSEILSVNKLTVLALIKKKKMKAINIGTGQKIIFRISKQSLEDFIKQNEQ